MCLTVRFLAFLCFSLLSVSFHLAAQEDSSWRISPRDINIQVGGDRRLQLLDDNAQELHGASWTVDNPDLAEIRDEDGGITLHPKAVGTVRVTAALNGEMRTRDITIWSPVRRMPQGTSNWGTAPIGREIEDLPAAPTGDGPNIYSLEQIPRGDNYLRAFAQDGIQMWTWLMPERVWDVELVCGDFLGGAVLASKHVNSYTLYVINKKGQLSWSKTLSGTRKGLAVSTDHSMHVVSQSANGVTTRINGFDEVTGASEFELTVPVSHETLVNVQKVGSAFQCTAGTVAKPVRTLISKLMINMDNLAYISFTQDEWKVVAPKCAPGSDIAASDVRLERDEKLILWQIHRDGATRTTVMESNQSKQAYSDPVSVASPTGALLTDNMNGVLASVRWSTDRITENQRGLGDEFLYRILPDGEVAFKFLLPKYAGPLDDDVVIGEKDIAFSTRGGLLIAFDLHDGKEVWRWDSNTTEISVFYATATGGCVVQTPFGIVLVENGAKVKDLAQGNVMMDWYRNAYKKHHH